MRVISAGLIVTRSQLFSFDHGLGVATASPPSPFSGSASFRRRPGRPSTWAGSLRVSLLDSPRPVALAGRDFHASLERAFPGD
jgi:hypothetical protein